jgi:hypothetical protein
MTIARLRFARAVEPLVPPRTPSFGTRGRSPVRSGESAVSPPRAVRRPTMDVPSAEHRP